MTEGARPRPTRRARGPTRRPVRRGGAGTAAAAGRYTPPVPRRQKVSPRWVPVLLFSLLALGAMVIVLNYLGVLPAAPTNWYLLLGLALITAGFVTATQWH